MKAIEFTKRFFKELSNKNALNKDQLNKDPSNIDALHFFPKVHLIAAGGLATVLLLGAVAAYSTKAAEDERQSHQLTLTLSSDVLLDTAPDYIESETNNTGLSFVDTQMPEQALSISDHNAATVVGEDASVPPAPLSPSKIEELSAVAIEGSSHDKKTIPWHIETVQKGDNLSLLFQRAGLSDVELYRFLSNGKDAARLEKIYPGQEISFLVENEQLQGLRYQKNKLEHIEFSKTQNSFIQETISIEPDIKVAYREAAILNSLFLAGTDVGMEEGLIMELASIFAWDIDFALDIRSNDSFKVMYEEQFLNGEKIGNGAILAAEFTNQNRAYKAVRYTDSNGVSQYYTPNGKSMRKAFLRTPVDFARISSHFNLKRKHPILNKIRAHKGTDYAAPTGTPIKAAGKGRVEFAGTKGGYGRTVVLRHGQSYKTLYAHMHKYGKGIRTGARVKQGQIIGYVGKSGLATGPHLHYEFYKNGAVRNPVRVELPKAQSIPKAQLAAFKQQTQPLVASIQQYAESTQIALSDNNNATN